MKIVEYRHFPGINIHCFKPALEVVLDLGGLTDVETSEHPQFIDNLVRSLPGLKEHVCGLGKPGGLLVKMQRGTYFGHVVEHVAIELLNQVGYKSSYGKTRSMGKPGLYKVVVQCHWPRTGLEAVNMACRLVAALVAGEDIGNIQTEALEKLLWEEQPGPSTQAIIDAAQSRGIPVKMMGQDSLLRLGTGCHRQYIKATLTGKTSCIGVDLAGEKILTKKILSEGLVPTPRGKVAENEEHAVEIARELGKVVVVKPCQGNQGKGVSLNLESESQVRAAYKVAENYGSKILVEEQVFGRHYRILVVNGKVEAVAERFPAQVRGDGVHTIRELIEIENDDPRRGYGHEKPLTKIHIDQVMFNVLARQNLTMNYVPEQDEVVNLRDNANLSTGGTSVDVTDAIHKENNILACRVARLLELDVAGVDVVTEDISLPILETGGAVIEVNAAPGIRMHLYPTQGKHRPVGDAIVDYLYPWGQQFRIPLVSVTGTNGKTTTARIIAHVIRKRGQTVGLASTDGIYIDGVCIDKGDNTGPASADVVLSDPLVEVAVLETARGGLARRGLGYQESDVGVVTNIAADHLGSDGIDTIEDLCHVKSLVVETVREDGFAVLNGDDPLAAAMAPRCPGHVAYFSLRPRENSILLRHLAAGGKGVYVEGNTIVLAEGARRHRLLDVTQIPITFQGHAQYNVANCLAATAALWVLGIDQTDIAAGLKDFDSSCNPGRANLYHLGAGVKVLLDYGHNLDGYRSTLALVDHLGKGRKVGVIGVPGDRKDDDAVEVGKICGRVFDVLYVKEDEDLRARRPGEIADLLCKGIESAGGPTPRVIPCEMEALKAALSHSEPGDLIAVFYEKLAPLQQYLNQLAAKQDFSSTR